MQKTFNIHNNNYGIYMVIYRNSKCICIVAHKGKAYTGKDDDDIAYFKIKENKLFDWIGEKITYFSFESRVERKYQKLVKILYKYAREQNKLQIVYNNCKDTFCVDEHMNLD